MDMGSERYQTIMALVRLSLGPADYYTRGMGLWRLQTLLILTGAIAAAKLLEIVI